ncbi:MAG: hypothetical protein ACKV2O_09605 [Acidimicrobiales bacterium]
MRRLLWMAAGAAVATGGSRWTKRKAAALAAKLDPPAVAKRAARRARHRVRGARHEARRARTDTEARLKAKLR